MEIIQELPEVVLDKIAEFFCYHDIKKWFLLIKFMEKSFRRIINLRNYKFRGKYELILDKMVFQYFENAFLYIDTDYLFYNGFIEEIYKNRELSIKIWKEKCDKYDYNFEYTPTIMENMLDYEYQNYLNGDFKKNYNDINQRVFWTQIVEYLNQ